MSIKSLKKLIVPLLLAILLLAILLPAVSFATDEQKDPECPGNFFTCAVMSAFNWIAVTVSQMISYVGAFLISVAATFIEILIKAGAEILENPLVTQGFKITLSVANLGFVLAIILIAFATILRFQTYGIKQVLWKLVLAALLINFSFTIAGTIIDFSNVFGSYFFNAASSGDVENFADNLADAVNIQKLVNIKPVSGEGVGTSVLKVGVGYFGIFTTVAATAIFNTFLVITFYALALMLLIRYIWVIILLILMPLAWLSLVLPKYSKHWSDWWEKFMKWNLFYPAVTFFLYLGISSSKAMNDFIQKSGNGTNTLTSAGSLANVAGPVIIGFLQIFVQVGIILGGLIAAESMGVTGAATALSMAKGSAKWIGGAAGKLTKSPFTYTGSKIAQKTGMFNKGGLIDRYADKFQGVPLLGRLSPYMKNAVASRTKAVEELDKKYGSYSKEAGYARSLVASDPKEQAYWANRLAKDGTLDKLEKERPKQFSALMSSAKKFGVDKDIVANTPEYAHAVMDYQKVYDRAKQEAAAQGKTLTPAQFKEGSDEYKEYATKIAMESFKPSKIDDLSPERITKLAKYFDQGHRERLGKEGTIGQKKAFADVAENLAAAGGNVDNPMIRFAVHNPAMQEIKVGRALEAIRKQAQAAQQQAAAAKPPQQPPQPQPTLQQPPQAPPPPAQTP